MTDAPPGWHPDPYGRYQTRYWDGARWTEHVATGDRTSTDPPTPGAVPEATQGPGAALPEVPEVVEAAELAFGYGVGSTQWQPISGQWPVLDRAGRRLATVWSSGGLDRKKSLRVVASDGRQVLTVGPAGLIGKGTRPLFDGMGRQYGELQPQQQQIGFSTPAGPCGMGVTQNRTGIYEHCEFGALSDAQGTPLGLVVNHAPRWPSSEMGGWPGADPRCGWLLLRRQPGLPEPLRSFFLAYPVLLAWHWLEWKRFTLDGTNYRTSPEHS